MVLYIGGDTDTLGAIAGACAEALYGIPKEIKSKAENLLERQCPYLLGIVPLKKALL